MNVQTLQTMEAMSVFCCWEESGNPEEHFMEIVHLKQTTAESIYSWRQKTVSIPFTYNARCTFMRSKTNGSTTVKVRNGYV